MDSSDESVDGWTFIKENADVDDVTSDQSTTLHFHDNLAKLNEISKSVENYSICESKLEMDNNSSSSEFDILEAPQQIEKSFEDICMQKNLNFLLQKFNSMQEQPLFLNAPTKELQFTQDEHQQLPILNQSFDEVTHDIDDTLNRKNQILNDDINENSGRSSYSSQSEFEVLSLKSNDLLNVCEMWDNYGSSTSIENQLSQININENELNSFANIDLNLSNFKNSRVFDQIYEIDDSDIKSSYSLICENFPDINCQELPVDISDNNLMKEHILLFDKIKVNFESNYQFNRADLNHEQLPDSYYDAYDPEQIVQMFHEIVRLRKIKDKTKHQQESIEDSVLVEDGDDRCESEMSISDSWDLSSWSGAIEMGDDGIISEGIGRRLRAYQHQPNPTLDHRLNILAISALIFTAGIAIGHYCGSNFNFRIKPPEYHQLRSTLNHEKDFNLITTFNDVILKEPSSDLFDLFNNFENLSYNHSFESENNIIIDIYNYSENFKYLNSEADMKFGQVDPINWYIKNIENKNNNEMNKNIHYNLFENKKKNIKNVNAQRTNWYLEHMKDEEKQRMMVVNELRKNWYVEHMDHEEKERMKYYNIKNTNWYLKQMENKEKVRKEKIYENINKFKKEKYISKHKKTENMKSKESDSFEYLKDKNSYNYEVNGIYKRDKFLKKKQIKIKLSNNDEQMKWMFDQNKYLKVSEIKKWGFYFLNRAWQNSKYFLKSFSGYKVKSKLNKIKKIVDRLMQLDKNYIYLKDESDIADDIDDLIKDSKFFKYLPASFQHFLFCQHKYFLSKEFFIKSSLIMKCEKSLLTWQLKSSCLRFIDSFKSNSKYLSNARNKYSFQLGVICKNRFNIIIS